MSNNSINLLCKSGALLGRSQTARAHWFCSQSVLSYGLLMRCFKHIATPESYHNEVRGELREISIETDSSSIISQIPSLYVMEEGKNTHSKTVRKLNGAILNRKCEIKELYQLLVIHLKPAY